MASANMDVDEKLLDSSGSVENREHSSPVCKKAKMSDDAQRVDDHAQAMKVAGFSLSAIEEMRNRAEEDSNSQSLDQQLRHFQVLDEIGSNSEDEEEGKYPHIYECMQFQK